MVLLVGFGDAATLTAVFFAATAFLGEAAFFTGVATLVALPPRVFLGVGALGVAALTGLALAALQREVFLGVAFAATGDLAMVFLAPRRLLTGDGAAASGVATTTGVAGAAALPLRPAIMQTERLMFE